MSTLSQTLSATERTRLRRHAERGKTSRADLLAVLDAGMICHLGVVVNGTHLDGLVCARSVFSHSVNYRCAVVFGTARIVTDQDERLAGLRAVTEQLIPGRWDAVRAPTRKELAATSVLALPLTEASVKVRTGPPGDEPEDLELPVWAGVVPMAVSFGEPEPDPALRPGTVTPDHIRLRSGRAGAGRSS